MIFVVGALIFLLFLLVLVGLAVALVHRLIYVAAAAIGVVLTLSAIGQPDTLVRLVVGGVLLAGGIVGMLRRRWRRTRKVAGRGPAWRIVENQPLPVPDYRRDTVRLETAGQSRWWRRAEAQARLTCAFDILAEHSRDARLGAARAECLRFVEAYPAMIPDMASATLAAEIENDVPDMVEKFLALAPHVTPAERKAAIDRMLTRLTALGASAKEAMRPAAEELHSGFVNAVERPYRRARASGLDGD